MARRDRLFRRYVRHCGRSGTEYLLRLWTERAGTVALVCRLYCNRNASFPARERYGISQEGRSRSLLWILVQPGDVSANCRSGRCKIMAAKEGAEVAALVCKDP